MGYNVALLFCFGCKENKLFNKYESGKNVIMNSTEIQ